MNFVEYYRARKKYYSMLIYIKIYSDKKNPEELEELHEQYRKEMEKVEEDQLPLFDRILDIEDMLMNCDEERFKLEFEQKTGKYYEALKEREELYKIIFDKTNIIKLLYGIEKLRPIIIKGKLESSLEIEYPELIEPLLNYIGVKVIAKDNKLEPTQEDIYEIIVSAPYKYLVRKDIKEEVDRILDDIEKVQSKLQLEIALRQIEDPDPDREESFTKNQELYLELRKKLEKYDITYLVEKIRAIFYSARVND